MHELVSMGNLLLAVPATRSAVEEESWQTEEYEKFFGSDFDESIESYAEVESTDLVVEQLKVTNRLLGIIVAFLIMFIVYVAISHLGRLVNNIFKNI